MQSGVSRALAQVDALVQNQVLSDAAQMNAAVHEAAGMVHQHCTSNRRPGPGQAAMPLETENVVDGVLSEQMTLCGQGEASTHSACDIPVSAAAQARMQAAPKQQKPAPVRPTAFTAVADTTLNDISAHLRHLDTTFVPAHVHITGRTATVEGSVKLRDAQLSAGSAAQGTTRQGRGGADEQRSKPSSAPNGTQRGQRFYIDGKWCGLLISARACGRGFTISGFECRLPYVRCQSRERLSQHLQVLGKGRGAAWLAAAPPHR